MIVVVVSFLAIFLNRKWIIWLAVMFFLNRHLLLYSSLSAKVAVCMVL
jgi:hypothetical protein